MAALLALNAGFVLGPPATAGPNNIQPDGRTQTTVNASGGATSVHTSTTSGSNAFNSFSTFTVGGGQVVNMHLPGGSANLINMVTDSRVTIDGMLNSIKGNKIGGNVFFASPHGFLVGSGGVVNVGSLTVSTPTRSFLDTFFTATGDIDALSVGALLEGSAPDEGGAIAIDGTVNATGGVKFRGGSVRISGTVYRGAKFVGLAPDFTDVVNVNGLAAGTKIVEVDGRIQVVAEDDPAAAAVPVASSTEEDSESGTGSVDIQASQDVSVSGVIRNEGSEGVSGGLIDIRAGNNIALESGANISAAGRGADSAGGVVNMLAANNAVIRTGAMVDASAGTSGNAGAIEFSAEKTVELAGGQFRADVVSGQRGSILIDPDNIIVSQDILRGGGGYGVLPDGGTVTGANLTLAADENITVNSNFTISSRSVLSDHLAGASTGNSGNITLIAPTITLNTGVKLLANADGGNTAGDITLTATRSPGGVLGGGGTAGITASGATIKGASVSLQAQSDYDDTGALLPLPLAIPTATASISLTDTSIDASGTLAIGAKSSVDTRPLGDTPLAISVVNSSATVDVAGAYLLSSTGNTTLSAESSVTANVTPSGLGLALPADAAVAISTINSTASVKVGGLGAMHTDAALELSAKNTVEATTVADISASQPSAVGGTVAVTVLNTVTQAAIEGSASTESASLNVLADSKNTVVNTAKSATKGANKQAAGASKSEKALDDYKTEGKTSGGSVEVAAAVAVVSLNSQTSAVIRSTGLQDSTGLVTVSSRASNSSAVIADGSSVGTGAVGVGAAVAINIGVLDNSALIADNARVTGEGLSLIADLRSATEKNSFSTQSTSGAGTSGVGVAGSLAVGTFVSTTSAALEGNTDAVGSGATVNAGTGDVLIQAGDATGSTVEAGATVTGSGDSAKVGVGASIGVNVGVKNTVAEVGNGAEIIDGNNMALNATAEHLMTTTVTGGAAGASVAVTPVAAVSVGINDTTARLGTGTALNLDGSYSSQAEQNSAQTTSATGQTEGSSVAVGASIAVGIAEDTVSASIDRNLTAANEIGVAAIGTSKSDTSAVAGVKGGKEADESGEAPAGQSVDEQVAALGDAAKDSGKVTADKGGSGAKLDTTDGANKTGNQAGKAETSEGAVSVAAAVGVNVASSETTASVGQGVSITSTSGAVGVTSTAETDASAKADGSQTDAGGTDVGVGAAVAVNSARATNTAIVSDGADVTATGLTIKAGMTAEDVDTGNNGKNDFVAESNSGAGASGVGVAGSLAVNVVANTTTALLQGDIDGSGTGASVDAGTGAILIEADNVSTSGVKAEADAVLTGDAAKVGVGASVGVNVVANKTVAEVADEATITGGAGFGLNARSDHSMDTLVEGGAAGAKISVTPLVAVTVSDNTTIARLGANATGLNLTGAYSSTAEQSSVQTTTATGQTQGTDVAVGASIAVGIASDTVIASVERDITAPMGVNVAAESVSRSATSATASVAGGQKADAEGNAPAEEGGAPDSGKNVDEQVATQGDSAKTKGKTNADKAPAAPATTGGKAGKKLDTGDDANKTGNQAGKAETSEGSSVSVAAAVGVNVASSETKASIGTGRTITSTGGALSVTSTAETDASAKADGSQTVAPPAEEGGEAGAGPDVGVGAAVAVNAVTATNTAIVSDDATVDVVGLTIKAGMDGAAKNDFAAESKSGAGAANVGVAGSLAVNIVANTTTALLQGDLGGLDRGASVNAGTGAILIEADNASISGVKAEAHAEGLGDAAKVGVGASVGVNVVANKTVAEVADEAVITGGAGFGLNASSDHSMDTLVEGGAKGAKTSVTPLVAVTVSDNTTIARLGANAAGLNLTGAYSSTAEQSSVQTTTAKGQTEGSEVAVGASIAVGISSDTVIASVERDISATSGVSVAASSVSRSATTAESSAAGGQKADAEGNAPAEEGGAPGKNVDEQVAAQGDSAKAKGKSNADKAPDAPATTGGKTGNKLNTVGDENSANKTGNQAGKAEADGDGDGQGDSVSVAAAVGVNVANSETSASIGAGRSIMSNGALSVTSTAETDAKALADGKATVAPPAEEGGEAGTGADIGVGVGVAVNSAKASNTATVSAGTNVTTNGLTVMVGMVAADVDAGNNGKNDFAAQSISGAGAADVGVAGSLAVNIVENTSRASVGGVGSTVQAGTGEILIEANNVSTSTVKAAADVQVSGGDANVGVGASVGVNVAVNKAIAEVADHTALTGGTNMAVNAKANHTLNTELVGGSAGAKTSITPVVAVSIGVNTTQARVGESATGLSLSGTFSSSAEQTHVMTTKATAQAQGDTAVGASLAAAIAVDDVSAGLYRDIDSSEGVELVALSQTSISTETTAGAKGAKKAKTNATTGAEEPEANSTVDDQKKNQLDFAKNKNTGASGVDTNTQAAKTPDTSSSTPGTDKPTQSSEQGRKNQEGSKISVAAAIGVSVARNQGRAEIGQGLDIDAGIGELKLDAQSDTNYTTRSSGEAVSEDDAVGVAVAITATHNVTQATLGAGTTVTRAGDVNVNAESRQNRDPAFQTKMSAEAVSGASGGGTAVAGALALVVNENKTLASIDEGARLGSVSDVGHVSVTAQDTSKISAQARGAALSSGENAKTGVGASFAVLVSINENHAVVGRDDDAIGTLGYGVFDPTTVNAESLAVKAAKNRVSDAAAKNLSIDEVKNLAEDEDFSDLKLADYLASNNYYTEAIAGAASQGDTAVAGAFSVNVFTNKSTAELGESVAVATTGSTGLQPLGVEVSSLSDMQSMTIAGAAAGAKQTGVGISNADTVNLDETRAAIGAHSTVVADGLGAGVKVQAESLQEMTNVGASAGASTSGTAVAGVLGVVVALGKTEARIGDGASVKALGDVTVRAHNDVTALMIAGGVAAASQTGVGASIAAQILANSTTASIGDADVSSARQLTVAAQAAEDVTSAVVAGTGAGTTGIAGALSVNVIVNDTQALVNQGAQVNTDLGYSSASQSVAITASDDTNILGITGGGAVAGTTGVGAALDTTVLAKTVKAGIGDEDTLGDTTVNARKDVLIDAVSSEDLTSVTVGFAGGGTTGVGGAVSIGVVKNDVQARIGSKARVDADGNVGVNAEDDIHFVLAAGGVAAGGTTGVGGSIGVATLLGHTEASIGDGAEVHARGLGAARLVYSGETATATTSIKPADLGAKKTELATGLSVTAYTREELITTVFSAGGGGTTGVAATVSADVIASTTEALIGESASINASNGSADDTQEVRVKAIGETSLINSVGGVAAGGSAGVGGGANVGVITKTITAEVGKGTLINAKKAVEVQAASLDSSLSTTLGFAVGGSVGVGGALGGVGVANTVRAVLEDGTSTSDAVKVNVSGGDLSVKASEFANSWMVSGAGAAGGSAGVGASISVAVNASSTQALIGNYAETNATGLTEVHADSTESVNTITVAGAAGGSAGVSGSIAINVVTSNTEAGIGHHAQVNQVLSGQDVDVKATDVIKTLAVTGALAAGGAAGVGGTVAVTVAQNTTQAYIGDLTEVSATQDVKVDASSDKTADATLFAGAGGGSAGVAGAVGVVTVGMLLDEEAKKGLGNGSTQSGTDDRTTSSQVGGMLGETDQAEETTGVLNSKASKLAISKNLSHSDAVAAPIPLRNTQASIGSGAVVKAGRDVRVTASDKTSALMLAGGAGVGGAAGVAGTVGVVLLRDSASATIADTAKVDAARTLEVGASTAESVFNVGLTIAGGGAAGVSGSVAVNVVSSDTQAAIGDADINQDASASGTQSVNVHADSDTEMITVAGSGGAGGAAAVGVVLNVNTLNKKTDAHIAEGADVDADLDVRVAAESKQQIIGAAVSVQAAGAAAVNGAASVNVIDNDTQAYIGSQRDDASKTAAHVDSDGNVVIQAADDTLLLGVSASVAGAGGVGAGGTVDVNVITSHTQAYLGDDSTVNARGNAVGASVYSGVVDNSVASALPGAPAGKSDLDLDGDGAKDGDLNNGVSFDVNAKKDDGTASSNSSVKPTTAKDSDGNAIANLTGGLGTRGVETVKGFSVVAVGSEKVVTTSLGIAAGAAAGVSLGATVNVISSVTEARIGDGAKVNQTTAAGAPVVGNAPGTDPSVRVRAQDDSLVVMAAGTLSGAGGGAVSGSLNTAVVGKQTSASIGDADVKAHNVQVEAKASEDLFLITANVSVAAGAGVGAAVSVASVSNTTTAGIDAGASVDATGDLRIKAGQDTDIDLYAVAGSAGFGAFAGGVSVGVVDNTTRAYVGGSDPLVPVTTTDAGGTTEVAATSVEEVGSITVAAAGGGVGVAGSVGVKVVTSETTAAIGNNARVNQNRGGAFQDVTVSASDTVRLKGGGGGAAIGAVGVGAISDTNIVRNTTTASIGDDSLVDADRDILVDATSSKNVGSTAVAAAGGFFAGVGVSVSVAVIGANLDGEAKEGLGGGNTASSTDQKIQRNDAGDQLGDSQHLTGAKSTLSAKTGALGVGGDMGDSSAGSKDKTQAKVGNRSTLTAGDDVDVAATDKTQLDLLAVGAGVSGGVGIGAAVGVGVTNSTTEAIVGSSSVIDAQGDVAVHASAKNVDGTGSRVRTTAGAGGVVGVSAAVAVLNDSSTTRAYLGNGAEVQRAASLQVKAETDRKASATTLGASAGALAIGASVARANFSGSTSAYLQPNVKIGQTAGKLVGGVMLQASDVSVASASATAGSAGILSGSGADSKATVESDVLAYMDSGAEVKSTGTVEVDATGTAQARADALGVNIGAGSVGASLASAKSDATIEARVGTGSRIEAAGLALNAARLVGSGPTSSATAFGATGGVLFGINATKAQAESTGRTSALVQDNATLLVTGATTVEADSHTQQVSSGVGISIGGLLAVGADVSEASSNTVTEARLGDGVKLSGGSLALDASGHDANYAHGKAGSGGLVSAPFSRVETSSTSVTTASTGSGNNTGGDARKIDVGALNVAASQHTQFDAWIDSTNASLIGVSGAKAINNSAATTLARLGPNGYIEADSIRLAAHNEVDKAGPGATLPGITNVLGDPVDVPAWNVDSASGGLADVPAASSTTNIVNNATAEIGAGTHLQQTGSVVSPGVFKVDAWNDVTAVDRVKMASGGAVSAASGKSIITADTNNATVRVGDGAALSGAGDITMGARSIADISTQTSVDVWGLVGVAPAGDSVSRFRAVNAIDVGNAEMLALNDIRLNAGASSNYNPSNGSIGETNSIDVQARTDVFNNTAIPVNRDPVADAEIQTHSQITLGDDAVLNSVRHAMLYAEDGTAKVLGVGVGKDIYREALAAVGTAISNAFGGGDVSFETRTGNSVKTQTSSVTVDGEIHVGTNRKQNLEIGLDGTVIAKTDGIDIASTGVSSLAQDIINRIDALNDLIRQYSGGAAGTDAAIAVAAYQSEIRFLERKLVDLGFKLDPDGGVSFAGVAGISPLVAAQQAVTGMTNTKGVYETSKSTLITNNSNLTTTNNNLTTANNNLTTANGTLQDEIDALTAQRNALPATEANAAARQNLLNQINAKNGQITTNNGTILTNEGTIDTNEGTIATNTTEIDRLTPLISSLTGQIVNLETDIGNGVYSSAVTPGPTATFLTISDVEAKLGNIYVRGDKLQGNGVLDAPGDAEIKITNNGPSFLILNNLSIPADEGGRIYLNSVDVKNNAQINGINGAAAGANFNIFTADSTTDFSGSAVLPGKPKILVQSKYDPLSPLYSSQYPAGEALPAPDIIVKGDISNLRGLVKIESAAGSIRLEENASIRADSVEVKTRNGDFVQSYSNTFSHVAGAPLITIPGDGELATFPDNIAEIQRGAQAGKGITANGSVLLAARYLNINGTVQSGIPEWGVRVPTTATVKVGASSVSFDAAKSHYDGLTAEQKAVPGAEYFLVDGATVSGLSGNQQGAWEGIEVSYNAKEDRLELSGVRVQGGYIEIFGQIFNTNQSGGGKLRVLDGYGQIKVDNESSKAMWVNLLDTGKGVKGEINITNITGIDASGAPIISTTQFLRDPGASRTGRFYDPQAGLRYTMTVGYDEGRVDYYRYSQSGWFGGLILSESQLDQYRIDSQVRSNDPLSQAEYLKVVTGDNSAVYSPTTSAVYGAGAITGGDQETISTAAPITTNGRSWRDCNWWTLCINATHYREFTITTSEKTTITESMKADQRIGVEFIGFDQGTVNVASVGDVVLNGAINNASGQTAISSSGSITQNGDLNIISGQDIALTAGTGIGTGTQAIQTNISDAGLLNATSSSGEVHIKEMVGNLNVGTIGGAGVSNVELEADKNIVDAAAGSYIQGRRVELLSNNGSIGLTGAPLTVRTGYTTNMSQWSNNGLLATARDSINIRNLADATNPAIYNGNLLLISAESKTGDVRIETSGAVIDNNPFETIDTRTEDELANLWDELRLRGTPSVEKANEAIAAFENGKNNNYRLYWQLRKGQADQGAVYDPGYAYAVSAGELSALEAAGLSDAQILDFAQSRTDQYHALHAEVGGLTASFDSGFDFDASVAEKAEIRAGSTWTDAQLELSLGAGLLKNITDTVTSVKEPNVKGNNIELVAGTSIGSMNPNVDITLPTGATPAEIAAFFATLTTDQKVALAAAERGDATVTGNVISIIRPRAVNVETGTGALTASAAAGDAFIGSENDLRINQVTASDNVRIKVAGALINAATVAGTNHVVGDNIILEAANGGIGAAGSALRINPTAGSSLIARAAGDIWIETPADLTVDTIFSRSNVNLDAEGSILDMPGDSVVTPAVNIRSNNVTLVSRTGSIGEADNALDVGVNPDGHIEASADTVGQGIYLNGPSGEHFNVGASTSGGATVLSAAEVMKVDGTVTGLGSISLVSGGLTTLTTQADVTSTAADIQIRAGSLTMEDDGVAAARVRSGTGSIDVETVGDAVITGIESGNGTASAVRVVSTAGRVLDGGDTRLDVIADTAPAAKFTVAGLLGVGSNGNPLDVRVRDLNASSVQGSVALAVVGGVNIESVSAGDAVQITAEGDITGNSVTSTGAGTQGPDKSVSVASTGGSVTLDSVTGTGAVNVDGQTGVDVNWVESTGGSVALNTNAGNVVVGTAKAQQDVTMTAAAGAVTAGAITATSGNVKLSALGDIEATTTAAGGSVQMTSSAGRVSLDSLTAQGDVSVDGQAGVQTGSVESIGGSVVLNTSGGDIDAGVTKALKDVTMTAASGAISADTTVATTGNVAFIARGNIDTGSTSAGGTVSFDSEEGDIRTGDVNTGGAFTVETAGDIETGTVTAGRDVSLISTRGTVTADNTRSVRGSVTMEGQQGVTANRVVAAEDVTLASARGAVDAGNLLARRGSITLSALRDIDVGTGSATSGSFVAGSTGGSVGVGTASADVVSLSAPRSVNARTLNVGSRLNLAGQDISANVNSTGAGDVGGSVTGFGGGMASNVELALSSPFAFRFQDLSTSTGNIQVLAGDLFVDFLRVGNRLSISNPRTTLLIDQNDRSIQPFDVQLYSAGSPFAFGLTGNRVLTGAFVISRGPGHEVISPNGNNLSAAELADRELSVLGTLPSPTDGIMVGQSDAETLAGLVTFVGTPVNGGDECESEAGSGAGGSNNSNCKEEK